MLRDTTVLQSHHSGIESQLSFRLCRSEVELQSHHSGIESGERHTHVAREHRLQSHHSGIESAHFLTILTISKRVAIAP